MNHFMGDGEGECTCCNTCVLSWKKEFTYGCGWSYSYSSQAPPRSFSDHPRIGSRFALRHACLLWLGTLWTGLHTNLGPSNLQTANPSLPNYQTRRPCLTPSQVRNLVTPFFSTEDDPTEVKDNFGQLMTRHQLLASACKSTRPSGSGGPQLVTKMG